MTLTAHPAAHKNGWTLANLRDAWKPVYDAIRYLRREQKPIEYIRVFEKHKTGEFHIHVLWRLWLPTPFKHLDWLSDTAAKRGLGWRVDWQQIDTGHEASQIARYITKYMSKDAQGMMEMPRGLRRIQTSQGIGALKKPPSDEKWWFEPVVRVGDVLDHDKTIDVSTGEIIKLKYFDTYSYYPQHERIDDDLDIVVDTQKE